MSQTVGTIAAEQLKSFIERIEKLEEEKSDIASCIRDVFAEAKANGYDTKAMREILKLRKMEAQEREEKEHIVELYKRALGLSADLDEDV